MDDTQKLQAMLDRGGLVTIPEGRYTVSKTLEVGDNTHVIAAPNTVIRLADGANCPILMNRMKDSGEPARGITLEGGVYDGNNTMQNRDLYIHPLYGWGQLVCFARTEDLCVRNLTIKDPNSFGITLTDTRRFTIRDIRFDCNCKNGNQDGVHVNGYAKDGYICNIQGNTNDDMVALNSDEGDFLSGNCDIENIVIDGVYGGDNGWTAVRLLSRKANVRNISIRNIFGAYRYNAVSFTHWGTPPADMGHFDNVVIENVFATCCRREGTGHGGLIWFQGGVLHVGTVILRNLLRAESDELRNVTCAVTAGEDAVIERLVIENAYQKVADGKPLLAFHKKARIGCLTIDGVRRDAADFPLIEGYKEA